MIEEVFHVKACRALIPGLRLGDGLAHTTDTADQDNGAQRHQDRRP